jgi:RNA polymerase sigma-B factor
LTSTGYEQERERLVLEHLGIVRSVAARFKYRGESLEDLQQIGVIGLIKAIDRFDASREVKLTTYAVPFIAGEIHHYLRDRASIVRIPRGIQDRAAKTTAAESELASELGRSPSMRELVERTGLTAEQIIEAQELGRSRRVQSLDQSTDPNGHDAPSIAASLGGDDPQLETLADRAILAEAIESLTGREKIVVGLRFLSDLTQSQIAERLNCSQMQVSRLQTRALRKLRERLEHPAP